MTETPRCRFLTSALLALVVIVFGAPWTMTSKVVSAQSQLFVALTDADGVPITDLTPKDVVVEVDGKHSETLNLEPIDWPVRVTEFVDNGSASLTALADMREGLRLFVDELPLDIEVAIATIGGRPQFWAKHTTDREELLDAIGVIAPQPVDAATFLDALVEEAKRLDDDEEGQYFPVMVMVSTNGPEQSGQARDKPFRQMMERLFANKATVHTLLFSNPSTAANNAGRGGLQERWGVDIAQATNGIYQGLISANGYRTLLPRLAGGHRPEAPAGEQPVSCDLRAARGRVRATVNQNIDHACRQQDGCDHRRERAGRAESGMAMTRGHNLMHLCF